MIGRWTVVCFIVLIAYVWLKKPTNTELVYPQIGYEIDELVQSNGYPFEYHNVTTSDGYILEVHRIPHGKHGGKENTKRPAILLMHGLVESSIAFVTNGADSFPYYLADRGYDVWLGNARGNYYSRRHVAIDPDKSPKEFFNFSWHEIGVIDLPNMIDYILHKTQHPKIFYLGHSQGCISFHVMMSEKPEYNKKVDLMLAFAPVVYTKNIKSFAFTIPARLQGLLEWLSDAIGFYEMLPKNAFWTNFGNTFCHDGIWTQMLCHVHLGLAGGFNEAQLNKTLLPLLLSHVPAGASVKQLFHYTQILNSDVFRQYDHGTVINQKLYGQTTPPLYKLENTQVPVAIFHSDNDWLTSERDIDVLYKSLPNVVHKYRVPDKRFNHFDFLISNNAIDILYPNVLDVLEKKRLSNMATATKEKPVSFSDKTNENINIK